MSAGRDLTLQTITVSGGGDTITATTTIPAAEVEGLIADTIEQQLGARPTDVRLAAPDRLTVELVVAVKGRFVVSDAGDLQVRITNGPVAGQVVTLLDASSGPADAPDLGEGHARGRSPAHRRPHGEPPGAAASDRLLSVRA